MKTKANRNNNCECHFEVEIPADVVDRAFGEVYKEIKKYAKIPGFRPGQAPQDLLEKYHGEHAKDEVLKRLIPLGYRQTLADRKIDAVGLPEISDIVFNEGKALSFKGKVDSRPKLKLKNYKNLKVTSESTDVKEEEVESAIKRLQGMHAQFEPVKEKRPLKKDDYATCDVEAFINGKAISKKHENMWIEVNKEASLLGMGEKLIGANTGDLREIETELPKDYPDKKYAGQKALFKIQIKEIKEKKLPKLDNEFAKDLGVQTIEKFKEGVRDQLRQKKESNNRVNMKNQIIDKLLKECNVAVPPLMVTRQYEVLMKRMEEELLTKGIPKDAVSEKKKELEPKLKIDAENQVRIYFMLEAIAVKENVKVDPKNLDKRFEEIGRMSQQDAKTVREYYEKNNLIDGLLVQLREEKTLDWLLGHAEIKRT